MTCSQRHPACICAMQKQTREVYIQNVTLQLLSKGLCQDILHWTALLCDAIFTASQPSRDAGSCVFCLQAGHNHTLHTCMVLQGALQTLRSGVLSRLSIPVNRLQAVGGAGGLTLLRGFAESTYIDKNVVTDRIINVVKNFDKVDPSKVGLLSPSDLVGLHAASARRNAGMQGCHPISNSISSKQAV